MTREDAVLIDSLGTSPVWTACFQSGDIFILISRLLVLCLSGAESILAQPLVGAGTDICVRVKSIYKGSGRGGGGGSLKTGLSLRS